MTRDFSHAVNMKTFHLFFKETLYEGYPLITGNHTSLCADDVGIVTHNIKYEVAVCTLQSAVNDISY